MKNWYPFWSPRFWHGMLLGDWLRLLARNRFRIHPSRWALASIVTLAAVLNSCLRRVQEMIYARRVAATEIEQPPVFIVGQWRSGTTFLHELLACDDRFAFPTTYECFAPNHFLVTGRLFPRLLWFLLPGKRPTDDMAAGFDRPQEDEFALVAMGAPSPYLRFAFPNHPPPFLEFLDMQDVSPADLARWRSALLTFVRRLTYLKQKRLVLKSPTHTGRIEALAQMFPGARFIHLVRDPYRLVPSALKLWQSHLWIQGLQRKQDERASEFVLPAFERMYRAFQSQRAVLGPGQLCEVRYEDLVRDPIRQLKEIYERLELGDFAEVQPKFERFIAGQNNYQTNRYELDAGLKDEITDRCGDFLPTYAYEVE